MSYPLVPPYAARREFHRPFWEMLSAAIARMKRRIFARALPLHRSLPQVSQATTCH